MSDVVEVKLPCGVDARCIVPFLVRRKCLSFCDAMNGNRHHRGRAVGQPDIGSGECNLHEVLRKIACRMAHPLMRSRDVDSRRVIVRAEVSPAETSVRGGEYSRQK